MKTNEEKLLEHKIKTLYHYILMCNENHPTPPYNYGQKVNGDSKILVSPKTRTQIFLTPLLTLTNIILEETKTPKIIRPEQIIRLTDHTKFILNESKHKQDLINTLDHFINIFARELGYGTYQQGLCPKCGQNMTINYTNKGKQTQYCPNCKQYFPISKYKQQLLATAKQHDKKDVKINLKQAKQMLGYNICRKAFQKYRLKHDIHPDNNGEYYLADINAYMKQINNK